MAEHGPCIGDTDDWFTPPEIFDALGLEFNLDPCSPGPDHWVPARKIYTKEDDGLAKPWIGTVFVNPPYGGRNGHVPWLVKFLNHADGIAIVRSYTSSGWWHAHMHRADALLWPKGKTEFVRPDGSIGKAPGHGVVLVGMGDRCCRALARSGLGMYWDRRAPIVPGVSATVGTPQQRGLVRGKSEQLLAGAERLAEWSESPTTSPHSGNPR